MDLDNNELLKIIEKLIKNSKDYNYRRPLKLKLLQHRKIIEYMGLIQK